MGYLMIGAALLLGIIGLAMAVMVIGSSASTH